MTNITVIKKNILNQETWRYQGTVLHRNDESLTLVAFFDRQDMLFHGMRFNEGDRFIETYYTRRWYNIFEIHDRKDDQLRGWYCNITQPAQIDGNLISYIDLALDLLVFPDGKQIVLDREEDEKLALPPGIASEAEAALAWLQNAFRKNLIENVD
jgi:predicted RNA-binding protein associated with RNAse of E/G family